MSFLKKLVKSVTKLAGGALGLDTGEDMGSKYEEQLRKQQELNKLNASLEQDKVAQFDETVDPTFSGTDTRRKKSQVGAYSNALGLKV